MRGSGSGACAGARALSDTQVSVSFAWAPGEEGRALAALARHSPRWRAVRWAAGGGFVAMALVTAGGSLASADHAGVFFSMLPWVILLGMFFAITNTHRVSPWLWRRRQPGRGEERTISAEGLDVAGKRDATFVPWSRVQRVVETDDFFLFECGEYRAHALPKRLLGLADLESVRRLAAGAGSLKLLSPSMSPKS